MNYKFYLFILFFMYTATITIAYLGKDRPPQPPSESTVRLCREYAERDHEKEFVPARWEIVKDLWTVEQWYGSCIDHSTGGWYTYTHGTVENRN